MKLLKCVIFIFALTASFVSAEDLPKYKMIDMGVFGTDYSNAIAINEKGQVLGTCEESGCKFIFLWDLVNGLKFIDLPDGCDLWQLKLNKNGQIAGVSCSNTSCRVFYWDSNLGFWEVDSSEYQINICSFNDVGQILGNVGEQLFLWDHGKMVNVTVLFKEQIS